MPPSELDAFGRFCALLQLEQGGHMELEPFQQLILADYFAGSRETLVLIGKKNGKGLALDTPMLTAAGWSTMGRMEVGDLVHATDGSLTEVTAVSEIHHLPCYRVRFADGAELVADDEHQWRVIDNAPGGMLARWPGERVATTQELYETQSVVPQGHHRYRVRVPDPLIRPEGSLTLFGLPLDPYVLGAWLGDAHTDAARVTAADQEILDEIQRAGFIMRPVDRITYAVHGLQRPLRALGVLGQKHVPQAYLLASQPERLALLQGLMDIDGTVGRGPRSWPRVGFTSTSKELAQAVMFLARSLGWKPTLREGRAKLRGIDKGPKYSVAWTAYRDRSPFRLERKTARLSEPPDRPTRASRNAIVSIEPVPSVPTRCIAVAHPSKCYLAGEGLTPTHNTTLLSALALFHLLSTPDAECVIAAASREQAMILFEAAVGFIRRTDGLSRRLKVQGGYRQIRNLADSGRIRVLAADVDTADGVRPTLALVDELHRHRSADLYGVFRDGLGPRHGQMITISTAGDNEGSPLGLMRAETRQLEEQHRDGAYFYACSADGGYAFHEWALERDADVDDMAVVKQANPASWQTIEELQRRHDSPSMLTHQWLRFACGIWASSEAWWIKGEEWQAVQSDERIAPGDWVALGFDGSRTFDCTALIACRLDDGLIEPIHVWVPPEDGEIPGGEVDAAVADAMERYRVARGYFDPPLWQSEIDEWAREFGERVVVRYPTRMSRMMAATERFRTDVVAGRLQHVGDPILTNHVLNAQMREVRGGYWLAKSRPSSPDKIDAAVAAVLAYEARCDEIAVGRRRSNRATFV